MQKIIKKLLIANDLPAGLKFLLETNIKKIPVTKTTKINHGHINKSIHYKTYPRLNKIFLDPRDKIDSRSNLFEVIEKRRSIRNFIKKSISKKNLSDILYYSAGINMYMDEKTALRRYPSAGAKYPLEIYLITINVSDISRVIWHYNIRDNSIEKIVDLREISNEIQKSFIRPNLRSNPSIIILISAVFNRTLSKYGDRGFRYIFFEAGHLAQNFYLVSTALNLGCCALGGFNDNILNKILDIDGISESVIYALFIGQPRIK